MRIFEADDAQLSCMVPEITDILLRLERHAHHPGCANMANIHRDAMAIVRRKFSSIVNCIFDLADMLTPAELYPCELLIIVGFLSNYAAGSLVNEAILVFRHNAIFAGAPMIS
jgi:hypothetical protein